MIVLGEIRTLEILEVLRDTEEQLNDEIRTIHAEIAEGTKLSQDRYGELSQSIMSLETIMGEDPRVNYECFVDGGNHFDSYCEVCGVYVLGNNLLAGMINYLGILLSPKGYAELIRDQLDTVLEEGCFTMNNSKKYLQFLDSVKRYLGALVGQLAGSVVVYNGPKCSDLKKSQT